MGKAFRLAFTADLHYGVRTSGDKAVHELIAFLREDPPDVLVIAGDIGAGKDFARCLALFQDLRCTKALVPGNHDIWVEENDSRGDSLQLYRDYLPGVSAENGFTYLDQRPLLLADQSLAVAGSINWYDYSWALEALKAADDDWEVRLRTKRFTRGRHNDARFVRWPLDDATFAQQTVDQLEKHLAENASRVDKAIVVAHHPAFYGLNFPRPGAPQSVDALLWDAFSGNQAMEDMLRRWERFVPFVFCGHTHRERENSLGAIHGFNIGGDYHFKRLITLDWPSGNAEAHVFGDPEGR
jgi:predicted phosphohydrolase